MQLHPNTELQPMSPTLSTAWRYVAVNPLTLGPLTHWCTQTIGWPCAMGKQCRLLPWQAPRALITCGWQGRSLRLLLGLWQRLGSRAGADFAGHGVCTPGQAAPGPEPPDKIALWLGCLPPCCCHHPLSSVHSRWCQATESSERGSCRENPSLAPDTRPCSSVPWDTNSLHPTEETWRKLQFGPLPEDLAATVAPLGQQGAGRALSCPVRRERAQPLRGRAPGARSALRKRGRPPHLLLTQQRARGCGTDSREAPKVGLDLGLQAGGGAGQRGVGRGTWRRHCRCRERVQPGSCRRAPWTHVLLLALSLHRHLGAEDALPLMSSWILPCAKATPPACSESTPFPRLPVSHPPEITP